MKQLILLSLLSVVAAKRPAGFIVGGVSSSISLHPHMLSLRHEPEAIHTCGATLISNVKAVTSAHCIAGTMAVYSLMGGTTDASSEITCGPTCQLFHPNTAYRHPNYADLGTGGYVNDIAVLTFNSVTYNANFYPIPLAQCTDGQFDGTSCVASGWGSTSGSSNSSVALLQEAWFSVVPQTTCNSAWPTVNIQASHICVQAKSNSPCTLDDGGPLVCGGKLAGIMSFAPTGCTATQPSVYTRISIYYDWIISI